ncbi:MAG: VWA domain-containing protein [Betaproteobacteria bacterium]
MKRRIAQGWLMALALAALVGCNRKEADPQAAAEPAPQASNAPAFVVLATTDLKDVQPLEDMALKATGVKLKFRYGGTMESTEAVLTGQANAQAAWFANAKYLLSDAQGQGRVKMQEKIMLSPLAVGVSESAAHELGWDDPKAAANVTWKTITKAAGEGKLSYALSNPATSNQGFMALMGVVAAAADKSEALTADDVDRGAIATFLKGYRLPGDNSTYLSERFIVQEGPRLNAFINYESWLLGLNASGKLREKLVLVYPREGVSTADYPFMLLDEARRDDYLKLVAWLKGKEAQTWLATQTLRRPVNEDVAKSTAANFPGTGMLVELPFSPDRQLADGLIDAYLNEFRKPIASTFVLDTSGSMARDRRLERLVEAIDDVAGDDASLTGRIARLTSREKIWMLPFSSQPRAPQLFEIPQAPARKKGVAASKDSDAKAQAMGNVRTFVSRLQATGGTALYDSILEALTNMAAEKKLHPEYQYSVVGFTDGENTDGRTYAQFQEAYAQLPEDAKAIPVFMVLFGDAKEAELKGLVKVTGGRVFDARNTPLYAVFKDIRAYQ